jgi:hypothetical protein
VRFPTHSFLMALGASQRQSVILAQDFSHLDQLLKPLRGLLIMVSLQLLAEQHR